MALLKIHTYPDPVLKLKASPWLDFGFKAQKFFDDMIETMHVEDGVGLAAPQVGISRKVLIACPTAKKGEEHVIVNPIILESSGSELGSEGCLSFPGINADILRAKTIKLHYQDRHGKRHEVTFKDFFARVIQHEMDHLEGILLVDRININQRQKFLKEYLHA